MSDIQFVLCSIDGKWQRDLRGVVQVGRGRIDGVALTEDGVSRRHATITVENGAVLIEDQKSTNGTFVNGKQILEPYKLRPGDRIRFFTQEYEFKSLDVLDETIERRQKSGKNFVSLDLDATAKRGPAWMAALKLDESDKTTQCSLEQRKEFSRIEKERREANLNAAPVKQPCLCFEFERQLIATIPLAVGAEQEQEWYIGRQKGCDVLVDDPSVSSVQAKILRSGLQWYVLDALSMNGTFVNDLQVGKQYLKSDDVIRFGSLDAVFRLPPQTNARRKKSRRKLYMALAAGASALVAAALLARFL
jgi:pSer/pThr/pTyr-binding forkhead associated (FHA) protein